MAPETPHRKRVKHYHEPGDVHEFTFSCYRRMPLLTTDGRLRILSECIDYAIDPEKYRLIAFVLMPEHVHLLVYPLEPKPELGRLLAAIKRPVSRRVKETLINGHSRLVEKLTVQERPGKTVFRFWQEGPGYDRNLQTEKAVMAAIDYIHRNPVRRRLCQQAREWKWSSVRFYESDGQRQENDLPTIHGLPAGWL